MSKQATHPLLPMSRRAAVTLLGAAAAGAMLPGSASAQRKDIREVAPEELAKPGNLPDLVLGPADAKVTIIEYASMTCGHCATFHLTIFPELKKKYVDTGKVRFILREFPLDNLAAAASMLARCAGEGKTYPMIEALFKTQDTWAIRGNPVPRLFEIAKQAGFTQASFDACLTNQKLLDDVTAVRTRASDTFGVNSTPTFFVNGKKMLTAATMAEFDKLLEPLLKG